MAIIQYSKIERTDYNLMVAGIRGRLVEAGTNGGMFQTGNTDFLGVESPSKISASHLVNLRTDIARLYAKCFNLAPTAPNISQHGLISYADWNKYATDVSTIESNYWKLNNAYAEVKSIFSRSSVAFSSAQQSSVRFTWASANDLEAFFNMGGDLRFTFSATQSQSPYAGSTKAAAYNAMFNNVGTMVIGHEIYSNAGLYSTGPSTGVIYLNNFAIVANVATASPYPSNTFQIAVIRDLSTQIHVRFSFNDVSGPSPNVDEAITVTVNGTYRQPTDTVGSVAWNRYPPTLGTLTGWQ